MGRARDRAAYQGGRSAAPVRSRPCARRDGRPWAAGHLGAAGIRRRRHGLHLSRPCQRRARIRRHVAAGDPVGSRRSELPVAPDVGYRAAETAVPGPASARKDDCRLRADRARRGQRRPRRPDDSRETGGSVCAERGEVVDLARRHRGQLPRRRLDGSREEATARSVRPQRVHRPAHIQGLFERAHEREVGHPVRAIRVG